MVRLRDIDWHCVKSVGIRSYSGSYFPAFGLNMERYRVSLCIQSECGKMRTRITPNTDTFLGSVGQQFSREERLESYFKILFNFLQKQFHFALTIQWKFYFYVLSGKNKLQSIQKIAFYYLLVKALLLQNCVDCKK